MELIHKNVEAKIAEGVWLKKIFREETDSQPAGFVILVTVCSPMRVELTAKFKGSQRCEVSKDINEALLKGETKEVLEDALNKVISVNISPKIGSDLEIEPQTALIARVTVEEGWTLDAKFTCMLKSEK